MRVCENANPSFIEGVALLSRRLPRVIQRWSIAGLRAERELKYHNLSRRDNIQGESHEFISLIVSGSSGSIQNFM